MDLNEKLARWAGWRDEYTKEGNLIGWYPPNYPDDKGFWITAPNFTESLDACFKWLVSKLIDKTALDIELFSDCGYYFCHIHKSGMSYKQPIFTSVIAEESPALALCKAIERLIDKENSDEQR